MQCQNMSTAVESVWFLHEREHTPAAILAILFADSDASFSTYVFIAEPEQLRNNNMPADSHGKIYGKRNNESLHVNIVPRMRTECVQADVQVPPREHSAWS